MDGLPDRLKEVRNELRMTQEAFGEACGVRRRAQTAYEAGERVPDAEYLVLAGKAGADVKYLLTGVRSTGPEREKLALDWLLRELCSALGVPAQVADACIAKAVAIEAASPDEFGKEAAMSELAAGVLMRSKRINSREIVPTLVRDLLTDVIRTQEEAWLRTGVQRSPIQKSHRIASLYEEAAKSGALNPELVEGGVVAKLKQDKAA